MTIPDTLPLVHDWTIADAALLVVVTAMGISVAYLRDPEQKATVLMLPVPFSLAMVSLGRPIDASNVLAVAAVFGYALFVWLLHGRLRVPILAAIATSACLYCLTGVAITQSGPTGDAAFWVAIAATMLIGAVMVWLLPAGFGRPHRTPLPLLLKTPAVAVIVGGLIEIKHLLGGFTTMFPMVGVVASYESRHSLWTIVRRIAWLLVLMPPMMAAIRLLQPYVGTPAAVVLAWPVFLTGLLLWRIPLPALRASKQRHNEPCRPTR